MADEPGRTIPVERAARAQRRLDRWREVYWLGEFSQLVGRLAEAELDEAGLVALLAEEPAALADRAARPDWAYRVEEILAGMPAEPAEPAAADTAAAQAGFGAVTAPFAELAVGRFSAALVAERLDALVDLDALRVSLAAALEPVLVGLADRTLVLELQVLRVTGRLTGESPQQRFWSFVRHFASADGLAGLLGEYPVLARLLVQTADRFVDGWLRMVRRLAADRSLISDSLFGGAALGRLVEATLVGGDRYDPRCPLALGFAGGARLRYQPRPLGVQSCLGEVVGWLNHRLPNLGLRPPTVVDQGEYGWVECVEHRPCAGLEEKQRRYYRWGALLALFHALGGADLAAGSVACCGDQPVPVDVTGLFVASTSPVGANAEVEPAQSAQADSVLRWDLLPADLAGAGTARTDHPLGYPAVEFAAPGTDQMRLHRAGPAERRSSPQDGEEQPGEEEQSALLAGFGAAYDALLAGRGELVGPGGLLWRFADAEVRVDVRPTRAYHAVLADSTHPDVLRDALDRERVLGTIWLTSLNHPVLHHMVPSELAELRAGASPDFACRISSRDVSTGAGGLLREVLPQTGLAYAARSLRALSPAGRARQEWITRAWLATHAAADDPAGGAWLVERPATPTDAGSAGAAGSVGGCGIDPQRYLAAARRLADQLAETAYQQGERVGWLGVTTTDERQWTVRPLGIGLYDGYPGVALFLAKLAELTGDERYATLARRALIRVPVLLESLREPSGPGEQPRSGPFLGVTGLAYALVQVAASLREPDLLDAALPPLGAAAMAVSNGEPDVIGGMAGCVAAMLAVAEAVDSPAARRLATAFARGLVRANQVRGDGLPWETGRQAPATPVGFARGASGIGWALLRHAKATGNPRSAEVGLEAFRYERGRWPEGGGWCRGVAGLGLARAACLPAVDTAIADDFDRALQAVLSAGPLSDHSLCHGELGNLELLAVAVEAGRADLTAVRERRAARFLDTVEDSGPRCGTPGGVITPGLLTGLAGIGYGLLRLAFPERVPSVLLLEPPPPDPTTRGRQNQ